MLLKFGVETNELTSASHVRGKSFSNTTEGLWPQEWNLIVILTTRYNK